VNPCPAFRDRSALAACGVLILMVALLGSCVGVGPTRLQGGATVTRSEAIHRARAYHSMRWIAVDANRYHGLDEDGVRIDTPDDRFSGIGSGRPGWWKAGEISQGMPYKWGGFDTPESFGAGLERGLAAGDVYTAAKRRSLGDAVSSQAVGIDCSGLVSRCWGLPRHHSTRDLPSLCDELPSYQALLPGDIINARNRHVLLFEKFSDETKRHLITYEAGSPPSWKVLRTIISISELKLLGYRPYRYRRMSD